MDNSNPSQNGSGKGWSRRVCCLQFRVTPGKTRENLARLQRLLDEEEHETGCLLLLPELWAGGIHWDNLTEQISDTPFILHALQSECEQRNIIIAGSLPERLDNGVFNTFFLLQPDHHPHRYLKQRLFCPMGEDAVFSPGNKNYSGPIDSAWGKLAVMICYDLRFPELATLQVDKGADILLVCAHWPLARVEHWRTLLQARAIENQIFVIACNACGRSSGTVFAGNSMIVGPDGKILTEAGGKEEKISALIKQQQLLEARKLFHTRKS